METTLRTETELKVRNCVGQNVTHLWRFDTIDSAFRHHNLPPEANRTVQPQSNQ
jgi:hypothetical protein